MHTVHTAEDACAHPWRGDQGLSAGECSHVCPAIICVDLQSKAATVSSTALLYSSMLGGRGLQCGLPVLVWSGAGCLPVTRQSASKLRAGTVGGVVAVDFANGSARSASSWSALLALNDIVVTCPLPRAFSIGKHAVKLLDRSAKLNQTRHFAFAAAPASGSLPRGEKPAQHCDK